MSLSGEKPCPKCGDPVSEEDAKEIENTMEFFNLVCAGCGRCFWEVDEDMENA